jgi:hypothetical protein
MLQIEQNAKEYILKRGGTVYLDCVVVGGG